MQKQQPADNDMDFDLFTDLHKDNEIQSTTEPMSQQSAFIRKSIHPPSAIAGYDGIPTNDARSQVLVQWRNPVLMKTPIIAAPPIEDPTAPNLTRAVVANDLTTFDYALLHTNGAKVLSIPFIYNKHFNSMSYDFNNVDNQDAYDFTKWQDDANLYRPVYKSTTTYLNATAFNDTGMVVANQFNPNIMFAGTLLSFAYECPREFKQFAKDILRYKCDVVDHKHIEYLKHRDNWQQFPKYIRDEITDAFNLKNTEIPTLDPNTTAQVVNFGDLGNTTAGINPVPSTSQIMNNSMRSFASKAKEGTFTTQRLNTVTPQWLSASNTRNEQSGLYECYYYAKAFDGTPYFAALFDNAPIGLNNAQLIAGYILRDTLWSKDMTWGWTYYAGLSLNQQAGVSTQLLIKKYYTGYEVQPTPRSAWSGMVKLGPKPDLMAMQALMDAFFELKDSMPARYNFWGALGSIAAQGLATFGSSLLEKLMSPKQSTKTENETTTAKPTKTVRIKPKQNRSRSVSRNRDTSKQIEALNRKLNSMSMQNPRTRRSRSRSNQRIRNNSRGRRSISNRRTPMPSKLNPNAKPFVPR